MHATYKEIGKSIAETWGPNDKSVSNMNGMVEHVLGDKIHPPEFRTLVCLLSAIHSTLQSIHYRQEDCQSDLKRIWEDLYDKKPVATDDPSDGMLKAKQKLTGSVCVEDYRGTLG